MQAESAGSRSRRRRGIAAIATASVLSVATLVPRAAALDTAPVGLPVPATIDTSRAELHSLQDSAAQLKESRGGKMSGEDVDRYTALIARIAILQQSTLNVTASPSSATVPGTLTIADPTFNRPVSLTTLSGVGTAVHYVVIPFSVYCAGNVTISTETADGGAISPNGSAGTGPDTFFLLYGPGGLNPASPLTNLLALNDDLSGGIYRSRIVSNVPAGSYTAVLTSYSNTPVAAAGDAVLPWTYTLAIMDTCVAAPPVFQNAKSRKSHGGAPFDLPLP